MTAVRHARALASFALRALLFALCLLSGVAAAAAETGDWQRWQEMIDTKPAQLLQEAQAKEAASAGWPEPDRLRLGLLHVRALLELGRADETTGRLLALKAGVEAGADGALLAQWNAYEGAALQAANQGASAMAYWERALPLARAAGDASLESFVLTQRIDAYLSQHDVHSAAAAIEADRRLADAGSDEQLKARHLYWAANLQTTLEDFAAAEASFREAASRFRALGNATWESDSQRLLANVLIDADRAREALEPAQRATALLETLDDPVYLALARSSLAVALVAHDRRDEALALSQRAVQGISTLQAGSSKVSVLLRRAQVLLRAGNAAAAVDLLRRGVQPQLPPESGNPVTHRRFQLLLAEACSALGDAAGARAAWHEVLRLDRRNFDRVLNGQLEAQRAVLEMQRLQSENDLLQLRSAQAERALKAESRTRWLATAIVALLFAAALGALWWLRRVNRRIAAVAALDALTGLMNRRSAVDVGHAAWDAAHRSAHPLAVLLLDVDHFKHVNDNHGHAAGDEVLRQVAALLKQGLRRSDHLARWGGEEFLVLLPGAPEAEAHALAERQRLAVGSAAMRINDGAETLRVTISAGVAGVQPGDADLEAAIARADRALYRAKHEGRDRVVVEGGVAPPASALAGERVP